MENHRTDSIPNDSYPVKSDRLLAGDIAETDWQFGIFAKGFHKPFGNVEG
jgi:hypothetical protein